MSGFSDFVGTLVEGVIKAAAPSLVSKVEARIPDAVREFASFVIESPATKDLIAKLAHEAGGEVSKLIEKGLGALETLIHDHVKGQVGAYLQTKLAQLEGATWFTNEQAQDFALLIASGKWDGIWAEAKKELGLP